MFLTLYYMAATWIQSWRLNSMRTKIKNILSNNGSLVLYKEPDPISSDSEGGYSVQLTAVSSSCCSNKCEARVGDLLWYVDTKRGCSIFPQQKINVKHWISFHNDKSLFPIEISGKNTISLSDDEKIHLLIEANYLQADSVRDSSYCQLEQYGIPRAWKASDHFALILETDVDHLAKLGTSFMMSKLSIDDGMELVRIESVNLEGRPCLLLNTDSIPVTRSPARRDDSVVVQESGLDFNRRIGQQMSPIQWRTHVELLQSFSAAAVEAAGKELQVSVSGYPSTIVTSGSAAITLDSATMLDIPEDCFPVANLSRLARNEIQSRSNLNLAQSSLESPKDEGNVSVTTQAQDTRSHRPGLPEEQKSSESFSSCVQEIENSTPDQEILTSIDQELEDDILQLNLGLRQESSKKNCDLPGQSSEEPSHQLPSPRESKSSDSFCSFGSASTISLASHSGDRAKAAGQEAVVDPRYATPQDTRTGPKPPNVLVFSESAVALENVKSVLHSTLHGHKYTIYSVSKSQLLGSPWMDNATLLVVSGSVPDVLAPLFMSFLLGGGRMLCLCSDFLHLVLPTFRTAEVRERELVRFSYGRWRQVRMMHHIFCYQASPVHTRFTRNGDNTNGTRMNAPPKTPSSVEVLDVNNKAHTLQVQVLGAEETWHTPSLLLATVGGSSGGRVVFSQVHLELDPTQYESEESKFSALQQSDQARREILQDLLSVHLGLECSTSGQIPSYTSAYFLGRHELKLEFLSQLQSRLQGDNLLKLSKLTLQFCGKGVEPVKATNSLTPVLIHACPANFSTVEYFENLQSEVLGRLVLYSDVLTSSMDVLTGGILQHGLAVVPRQQTNGSGRGGNMWLSPEGCAMFSIQLHIPRDTYLGQHIPFLQHVVGLAIVSAISTLPGYKVLNLRLKWPNDIYIGNAIKIGGLIVNSLLDNTLAVCNVGCGINLNNKSPTTCINALIEEHNQNVSTAKLATLTCERLLALVFTELERLLDLVQSGQLEQVLDLYYSYWLHGDAIVSVVGPDSISQPATVVGVDEFGFLRVKGRAGSTFSVHPDGNSFDMLRGLVFPKGQ